jgi:hypothetical protein
MKGKGMQKGVRTERRRGEFGRSLSISLPPPLRLRLGWNDEGWRDG